MKRYWLQVYRVGQPSEERPGWVNIDSLDYHPELLHRLRDLGMIDLDGDLITIPHVTRVEKILRLRSCLGVNLAGASIILDLLDKVEELQEEVRTLRRKT